MQLGPSRKQEKRSESSEEKLRRELNIQVNSNTYNAKIRHDLYVEVVSKTKEEKVAATNAKRAYNNAAKLKYGINYKQKLRQFGYGL